MVPSPDDDDEYEEQMIQLQLQPSSSSQQLRLHQPTEPIQHTINTVDEDGNVVCKCGIPAAKRVCRKPTNPNRYVSRSFGFGLGVDFIFGGGVIQGILRVLVS